jgi:hypothetical protein
LSKEAVGVIFDCTRGKAKRDEDAGEGAFDHSRKKKKNKPWSGGSLMAAAEHKGKKASIEGTLDHFEKMLEGPCPNHTYPIKHAYKDCGLMKNFLDRGSKQKDGKKKPKPPEDTAEEKEDTFPQEIGCLMIFDGPMVYDSKCWHKLACQEVYAAKLATPAFLRWSRSPITFDRSDHPDNVPHPSQYPLVIDPIIDKKRLSKVLMDGGSGLNIIYAETLNAMGVDWARVWPTGVPFHGIVPGKQAKPLGQIDMPITFGDKSNFRTETLTFEVVGFHATYHAILGRLCYTKFMAVSNYMYLKLKMPGPHGVITVSTSF